MCPALDRLVLGSKTKPSQIRPKLRLRVRLPPYERWQYKRVSPTGRLDKPLNMYFPRQASLSTPVNHPPHSSTTTSQSLQYNLTRSSPAFSPILSGAASTFPRPQDLFPCWGSKSVKHRYDGQNATALRFLLPCPLFASHHFAISGRPFLNSSLVEWGTPIFRGGGTIHYE